MPHLPVLSTAPLEEALETRLLERTESRVLSPAREAGYELRLLGATVLPQRQVIARTSWGTWLFVNHVDDPTADRYGLVPVPADQHQHLTELDAVGVRPDLVWMAHELPATWRNSDPIPQLVPTPRHLREKDQRLTRHLKTATQLFVTGAGATLALAAAPLALAGAVAAGVGLDPIVLGGIKDEEHPVVQWVLLAQWDWE